MKQEQQIYVPVNEDSHFKVICAPDDEGNFMQCSVKPLTAIVLSKEEWETIRLGLESARAVINESSPIANHGDIGAYNDCIANVNDALSQFNKKYDSEYSKISTTDIEYAYVSGWQDKVRTNLSMQQGLQQFKQQNNL